MKIIQINSVPNGSTGTIMLNIHNRLLADGIESYAIWGRGRKSNNNNEIYMNDNLGVYMHALYSRITGRCGYGSKRATKKLLLRFDEIKPDVIHLHNIHGYYINIEMLFNYIKEKKIKVIWTLHDCWAFTGNCAYFDMIDCNKWKKKCKNCPQKYEYPKSIFDNSLWCYENKKKLFSKLDDMTIVTPSEWLSNLVKKSFLKDFNIFVINNGINTDVFKVIKQKELNFKEKYNLKEKKIILGVASPWSKRKGLNDFLELSNVLSDEYKIVLVGLNKRQLKKLPKNILGLKRTSNINELVDIYNSADIFFNPTYEDNYPTTNIEAICCGTKVVTYNTGGSPEIAKYNGEIVTKKELINNYKKYFKIDKSNIVKKDFSIDEMYNNYKKLYLKRGNYE